MLSLFLLSIMLLVGYVHSHSFVQCTDYRPPGSLHSAPPVILDNSYCYGYARGYTIYDQQGDGYAHRPKSTGYSCDPNHQQRGADRYTQKYPMASYRRGRDVCIEFPARNHAISGPNGEFNGPWLNSGNVEIYWSEANTNCDSPQSVMNTRRLAQTAFSDCAPDSDLLENNSNDRPCRGCFTIPADSELGHRYFQWVWEFNIGEWYSTCWDAMITDDGDMFKAPPADVPAMDPSSYQSEGPPDTNWKVSGSCSVNSPTVTSTQSPTTTAAATTAPPSPSATAGCDAKTVYKTVTPPAAETTKTVTKTTTVAKTVTSTQIVTQTTTEEVKDPSSTATESVTETVVQTATVTQAGGVATETNVVKETKTVVVNENCGDEL
eukprot:Nk52_evm42s2496 gene=Nk52_evmTU42s2496